MNIVGRRVAILRTQRGWTLQYLADKLTMAGMDCDKWLIRNIEMESRRVYDYELPMLATALGVRIADLMPI